MADNDEWADLDALTNQDEAVPAASAGAKPGRKDRKAAKLAARQERREQWKESAYAEKISPGARAGAVLAIVAILAGIGWILATAGDGQTTDSVGLMKPGSTMTQSALGQEGPKPEPSLGMGTNTQAAVPAPPTKTAAPVTIPAPQPVTADQQKADEVAKAWAEGYLSRPGESSKQWQEFITPYTAEELLPILDTLAFHGSDPLAGKEPTQVLDVTILPAPKGEPVDTPTRWTRNVEVPVQSHDGSTTVLTYTVTSYLGEKGWQVTDAVQKHWTAR